MTIRRRPVVELDRYEYLSFKTPCPEPLLIGIRLDPLVASQELGELSMLDMVGLVAHDFGRDAERLKLKNSLRNGVPVALD